MAVFVDEHFDEWLESATYEVNGNTYSLLEEVQMHNERRLAEYLLKAFEAGWEAYKRSQYE